MTKNEVLINKVSNSDNLNNEFTGGKNDMILENDNENMHFMQPGSHVDLVMACLLYTSRCV